MRVKDYSLKIKSAGPADGLEDGQFVAYASVFGNIDSYGDVVQKGAFSSDLKAWAESDAPIPLLWGHDLTDMNNNIGHIVDASEDDHGLLVKAQLDLDMPNGATAYRLIKGRRVTDLSFAYDVLDETQGEVDGQKVNELRELKLYEVSVVPIGANRETEFLAVKAAAEHMAARLTDGMKAGRVISAKNESALRSAHTAIGEVLATLETDQEKASGTTEVKVEEPSQAKAEEQPRSPSAKNLATLSLLALN